MKQRPGGFPTIRRPAPPPAAAAVEVKPAEAAEPQAAPRIGFPRPWVQRVPAAVKYDAPPAPPPLPLNEFADGVQDAGLDDPDSAGSGEAFPEPLYEDDDAPIITAPLPPPPRPEPTVLHPTPASRAATPPVRQPKTGLLSSNVGPQPSNRPTFLPPPRPRGYVPAPPLPQATREAAPPPVRQPGGVVPSSGGAQPRALPSFRPPPSERPEAGRADPAMPPPAGTAPATSDRAFERLRKSPPAPATMAAPKPPVRKQPGPQPIEPDDIPFDL